MENKDEPAPSGNHASSVPIPIPPNSDSSDATNRGTSILSLPVLYQNFIPSMSSILDDKTLWVGNIGAARISSLRTHGITHVLTVHSGCIPEFEVSDGIERLQLLLPDDYKANLLELLPEATSWIDKALEENGTVLVHCTAGVSRSPSIVIAWLVKSKGYSYEKALDLVVEKRKVVNPNRGFRWQLSVWGRRVKKESSSV